MGSSIIAVMQPFDSIEGKNTTRDRAASSPPRRSLPRSKMRTVLMSTTRIRKADVSAPLGQCDHMVKQLAAANPHPAFGDTILPTAPYRRLQAFDSWSGSQQGPQIHISHHDQRWETPGCRLKDSSTITGTDSLHAGPKENCFPISEETE